MSTDVELDVGLLKDEIEKTYACVSAELSLGRLSPGEHVLDLGSGAGTDSLVAAQMVEPRGRVTEIDMTPRWSTVKAHRPVTHGTG